MIIPVTTVTFATAKVIILSVPTTSTFLKAFIPDKVSQFH